MRKARSCKDAPADTSEKAPVPRAWLQFGRHSYAWKGEIGQTIWASISYEVKCGLQPHRMTERMHSSNFWAIDA
jgi:hypothetical protein